MIHTTQFILNPNIALETNGGNLFWINKTQNLRKECQPTFKNLLKLLEEEDSFTLDHLFSSLDLSEEVIDFLINYSFVIPKESINTFSRGINYYPAEVSTERQATMSNLLRAANPMFILIGLPFDAPKQAYFSTAQTPKEIRKRINTSTLSFLDIGNISYFPHKESLEMVGLRLDFLLRLCNGKKHFPLFLGGDHSISMYTVNALLQNSKEIGIIHFDAHHDLYYDSDSMNHLNHANVFFHLAQQENVKSITQIGVRTPYPNFFSPKIKTIHCRDSKVEELSNVFKSLPKEIDYYLSFDIDVLDPSIAPDVVAPMENGLTLQESKNILSLAFQKLNIVGLDIVEACTTNLQENKTIDAACEIISHCLACKLEKGL